MSNNPKIAEAIEFLLTGNMTVTDEEHAALIEAAKVLDRNPSLAGDFWRALQWELDGPEEIA